MRRFLLSSLLTILVPFQSFASVSIVALLPNPIGDDTLGEYIDIRNTGCLLTNISGYTLSDLSGKTYILPDLTMLSSHETKRFPYSQTKITLNNSGNEAVYLKNNTGLLIDEYQYSGTQKDNVVLNINHGDEDCSVPIITNSVTPTPSGSSTPLPETSSGSTELPIMVENGTVVVTGSIDTGGILPIDTSGNVSPTNSGNTLMTNTGADITGSGVETSPIDQTGSAIETLLETGALTPIEMWYSDTDKNKKIDTLEILYPYALTGIVNTGSILLFSRSGGLSFEKIDTLSDYILSGALSGSVLILKFREGNIEKTILHVTDTTTSDLRLKSSGNLGFRSVGGQMPEDFFLTKSFHNYKNVYARNPLPSIILNEEIITLTGTTQSGDTNNLSESTGTANNTIGTSGSGGGYFPEIFLTIQSPTNATQSGDVFECSAFDICRININFESIFTGSFLEKDYSCLIVTHSATFSTCNPNTLYFSTGDTLSFELTDKISGKLLKKSWGINFTEKPPENNVTGAITGALLPITFPEIIPTIQSPTNASFSGDVFTCTSQDCRINITLEPIFLSGYTMKDYVCAFGTGDTLTLDTDCNPNTFYFTHSGSYVMELTSKKSSLESIRKIFSVVLESHTSIPAGVVSNIGVQGVDTGKPVAILDLDTKWKEYYETVSENEINCYTDTCSLNWSAERSYDPEGSKIRFLWIFAENETSTSKDPGSHKYTHGSHRIILRVIDEVGNYDEVIYTVHVLGPKPKTIKEKVTKSKEKKEKLSINIIPEKKKIKKIRMMFFSPPEITLQGKNSEMISPGNYVCHYKRTATCSFNLALTGSIKGYEYTWTLDGIETHKGKNPKAWKLTPGYHVIIVRSYMKGGTTPLSEKKLIVKALAEPKKIKTPKKKKTKKAKTSKISIIPETHASSQQSGEENPSPFDIFLPFVFLSGLGGAFIFRKKKASK